MYALKEYEAADLPNSDVAIKTGMQFANSIETQWSRSPKAYPEGVVSYVHWSDGDYWAARVSRHNDITYEDLAKYNLNGHTQYEAEYIDMVQGFETLDVPDSNEDWHSELVHYRFPFPLKPREMCIWLTAKETKPGKEFVIVTLPRKFQSAKTKAYYVSVEVVTKEDDNSVRWVMATTSDAGGWVPQFLQRRQVASEVPKDVPQFKKWLEHKKRSS